MDRVGVLVAAAALEQGAEVNFLPRLVEQNLFMISDRMEGRATMPIVILFF